MYETKAEAGSHLFWEGDVADKLYFLIRGRVKITKSSDEGRQFILYMYQDGDMFGQVDPYQDSTQGFNAEVAEPSTVGVIQKKDLEVLLWQHGDLAVEFMKWMGLIHRMTQTKFRDLMMFGKPGALCSLLIRLHNTYGEPRENGVLITKRLTNSELADMIGATRESVNRMLSDFKAANVVTNENGLILIKDLQYLKDICHCENCPADICRM
ncbi:Crp/Fnr family transcriptional regulator [Paenibacillus sp. TRM 82003]|nr:Crp/Fnr family transcriptional regulator [Paenibacillus sp. TRM 82003]